MNDPVLGFLGAAVGAVLTFLGVRFSARQSAKAADAATKVESRQVDVGEWQAIVSALRDEVQRLSTRVDALEGREEAHKTEKRVLLSYARALLVWGRRVAPNETPPEPPAIFADELLYITER